jgi:HTH domain in Mos1 transposase
MIFFIKGKMSKTETDQHHIRHCMLLFFDQGLNTTKATKAINEIYVKCYRYARVDFGFRNLNRVTEI